MNDNSTTLYASPQIETLLGYSAEEYIKDPELWVKKLYPEDKERVLTELERCHTKGEPFKSEYRMFTRDGKVKWLNDEACIVHDERVSHFLFKE